MSSVAGSRTHFNKRDAKCSIRSFSSVRVEELEEKKRFVLIIVSIIHGNWKITKRWGHSSKPSWMIKLLGVLRVALVNSSFVIFKHECYNRLILPHFCAVFSTTVWRKSPSIAKKVCFIFNLIDFFYIRPKVTLDDFRNTLHFSLMCLEFRQKCDDPFSTVKLQ